MLEWKVVISLQCTNNPLLTERNSQTREADVQVVSGPAANATSSTC
jgi:hypothetical protein